MKQTTKTLVTVGVLALVATGVAFVAAWAGKDEEQKATAKAKDEKIFELESKAKVREIKLSKAGKLVADAKRDDDKSPWKLLAPVQDTADEGALEAMASKLADWKQKSLVEGMDPKQGGVVDEASARLSLVMTDADGKSATLLIGEENPFDQTVYVRHPADKDLRLVAKTDITPFDKQLFDLRDKRVAQLPEAAEVKKLEVAPPGKSATTPGKKAEAGSFAYAAEHEGGTWKLSQPVSGAADSTTIDRLVASVKSLRATAIATESADAAALAGYGLTAPKFTVSIAVAPAGKEAFTRKLLIGQPPKAPGSVTVKTYAKRDDSPVVYEVDAQIARDLAKELFDLQDKSVAHFERTAVTRIEYAEAGKETIAVLRKMSAPGDGGAPEETFEVSAPKAGPAKKWKASGNLYTLAGLKAAALGEPIANPKELAKYGLDKPRTITIYGDKDAVLAKLLIGGEVADKDKKRRWVMVAGEKALYQVEKATLDDLPQKVDDVLDTPAPPPTLPTPALPAGLGAASAPAPN